MAADARVAFIFPGQGSQVVGMGQALAQAFPTARQLFEQADDVLGFSLSKLAWEGPEADLNDTINTQPALLVHSVAAWHVASELFTQLQPAYVAGHSMGELSALVAAGALEFPTGLLLARRRGELMKKAGELSPGGMAAILGVDIPTLEKVCAQASQSGEIVQVANDNCPGQVVISGENQALERAIQLAQQAGARKTRSLAVSIAAHSPLMSVIQADFNQTLQDTTIEPPIIPVVGNVTAQPLDQVDEIRNDLSAQLTSRVRWTESIQVMVAQGVTTFIEFGAGSVLTGLLKRIDPAVKGLAMGAPPDFDKLINDAV